MPGAQLRGQGCYYSDSGSFCMSPGKRERGTQELKKLLTWRRKPGLGTVKFSSAQISYRTMGFLWSSCKQSFVQAIA